MPERPLEFVRVLALACLWAGVGACGGEATNAGSGAKPEVCVFAAVSTRDALLALEPVYERDHAVDLTFNFGSSGDLARQILAAPRADVFLSADEKEMDRVERGGHVAPGTRADLLSNQLVVIVPSDAPLPDGFTPADLAGPGVKRLSLANVETVPAGRYAKAWLETAGVWPAVAARVLPAVDVRAALTAVESGAAQAGIVYRTDAARSTKARIVHAVPVGEGPRITYPLAVVAGRPHEREARAFAAFLASDTARTVFEGLGFVVLPVASARGAR